MAATTAPGEGRTWRRLVTNNYPKLHNAMWPGVVGKGSGDGEPFIPLDTLLTLTANAEYDGQKFDGVDLWLADPHISIDSRRPTRSSGCPTTSPSFGLKIGSFVAPIWGGAGGGSAMGVGGRPQALPRPGEEGLRHRQADARPRHPPDRRRPDRLLDQRRGLGQGSGRRHEADRRDLPRGRQDRRRTTASSSSPRARSAGAACIPGGRT